MALEYLPPLRMELANYLVEQHVDISHQKSGSRVVQLQTKCVLSVHVHVHVHPSMKKTKIICNRLGWQR